MSKPARTTLDKRRRSALAVPLDERGDEWIAFAWTAVGDLRARGHIRDAEAMEDAIEVAERRQDAEAKARAVDVDRWQGRWIHRGERVVITVMSRPMMIDGRAMVLVQDEHRKRWEWHRDILDHYERLPGRITEISDEEARRWMPVPQTTDEGATP